jgi:NADH dehydrogenase
VEVAGELRHLLGEVLPRYYRLRTEPRVVLIHSGDRILRGWDETLAARGEDELRSQGIELYLSTRVTRFDGRAVTLSAPHGTDDLEADTLIWTAGTRPETGAWDGSPVPRTPTGHVPVEPTLALAGSDHVFSVGDVTSLRDAHSGVPYPPVAPIAISQGVRAAANIVNAVSGRPPEPYRAYHAGKIISLGNGVAFADVLGIQLRGRPAWMLYRGAYLLKLVGAKNKLRAAMSLLLNRVFERDLSVVPASDA